MTVTGPITGGARGRPFSMPLTDLDAIGYTAEEFFVDGDACAYELEPGAELRVDGRWDLRAARRAPFRTRMLVVRPTVPERATGVVHVNWQNVTAGFEIGSCDNEQLLSGHTWVGVTAQLVGVEGFAGTERIALKGWDPERYGSLEHPGDDFSFDVFTQVARALDADTLGGVVPRVLVGTGGSQSAMRLRTYVNAVQPLERVFDAFMLQVDFGRGSEPDTVHVDPTTLPMGIRPTVPVQIRDDLGVPVLVFNTETEAPGLFPVRQPDTDHLRLWEVAGACHTGGVASQAAMAPMFERDGIEFAFGGSAGAPFVPQNPNVLPFTPAYRAAFAHFHRWLDDGTAPPAQPRIDVAAGEPPTVVRDGDGNALGGIRLPDFAVPTGVHQGANEGDVLASLIGYSRAFTHDELVARYGDGATYLERWNAALDDAVASGCVLAEDAPAMRAAAEEIAGERF